MAFIPESSSDVKGIANLRHFRGNDFDRLFQFQQTLNVAEDLTGCSFSFKAIAQKDINEVPLLSGSTTTGEITFQGSATLGVIRLYFPASVMIIPEGFYSYSLTQTSSSGSIRTRLKGKLIIEQL